MEAEAEAGAVEAALKSTASTSLVRTPLAHPQGFVSFGAHIQTVWPKRKQYSPNPSRLVWLENLNSGLNSIILAS